MPKCKTSRSVAKRFKINKKGKIKSKRAYLRHILTTKSRKQKRRLRKPSIVSPSNAKHISRLLPYGSK